MVTHRHAVKAYDTGQEGTWHYWWPIGDAKNRLWNFDPPTNISQTARDSPFTCGYPRQLHFTMFFVSKVLYTMSYDFRPGGDSCRARRCCFNKLKIIRIGPTEPELWRLVKILKFHFLTFGRLNPHLIVISPCTVVINFTDGPQQQWVSFTIKFFAAIGRQL